MVVFGKALLLDLIGDVRISHERSTYSVSRRYCENCKDQQISPSLCSQVTNAEIGENIVICKKVKYPIVKATDEEENNEVASKIEVEN